MKYYSEKRVMSALERSFGVQEILVPFHSILQFQVPFLRTAV